MSFKPDVTTEEEEVQKTDVPTVGEEVQKASPHIPHVQHEQAKVGDNESIEMIPLPTTNDSQGGVQLLALPCLQIVLPCVCLQKLMNICH